MDEGYIKHVEDIYGPMGVKLIESDVPGLNYAVDGDRKGIVIIGKQGMAFVTRKQAAVLAGEIAGILEVYL